jgi:carboxyl-terminal processing protease
LKNFNIRIALCTTLAVAALSLVSLSSWATIDSYPQLSETALELMEKLERRHYSKRKFDDELSSELLDSYLKSLDPSRSFLYQSDIDEFEAYRLLLDDHFSEGNLEAGFVIFNRYHQRIEERLNQLLAELPDMVASMDFSVDENLSLEPENRSWPSGKAEADDRWRKQIKNSVLSLKLADKASDEIVPILEKRYRNQLHRITQYNAQDVFQVYANALTELYDPHTNYLSPRTSENFNINMSLSLEGIGAVLQLQDEYTRVSRIVPAGPADKQGDLQPSDRIVSVAQGEDGEFEDVVGWRLDEVVQLIRGPKGTTVRLEILPASSKTSDEHRIVTIVRNKVKLEEQSAQKEVLEFPHGDTTLKLGVIDVPAFYIDFEGMRRGEPDFKSTTRDVKRLLDELMEEGVDGIIIDLRNNGGGSLQEANDLTGLFIEYGPTVQIRHSSRKVFRDGKRLRTPYYDGPMAVLINRLSASASEIFAGAIQDYQRGIIVGSQSFGKGTVQTLIPLAEGQLKLTESKFYRISGDSTQHRGVVPDVEFPSQYDKSEIGESNLDHALNWDQINPVRHRKYHALPELVPYLTDMSQSRITENADFIYLQDSLSLAEESRAMTSLPLQEEARIVLRDTRKAQSLAIENKRRSSKGLPLLDGIEVAGIEEDGTDSDGTDSDSTAAADSDTEQEEEEERDALLLEAGNILIDVVNAKNQMVASNPGKTKKAQIN